MPSPATIVRFNFIGFIRRILQIGSFYSQTNKSRQLGGFQWRNDSITQ
jgi:hypothetical protein